jgi:hypothetical protein
MTEVETTHVIHVEIYDMMGVRVMKTDLFGQKQYDFNLTGWPKSVYLIRVVTGDEMSVQKLIKR